MSADIYRKVAESLRGCCSKQNTSLYFDLRLAESIVRKHFEPLLVGTDNELQLTRKERDKFRKELADLRSPSPCGVKGHVMANWKHSELTTWQSPSEKIQVCAACEQQTAAGATEETNMNRQKIYELIEAERANQDRLWPRNERRIVMYGFSAPHLLLIGERIDRMRSIWYNGEVASSDFVKIAAIVVRALEEINTSEFKKQI